MKPTQWVWYPQEAPMQLSFFGPTQTVTGSRYLLTCVDAHDREKFSMIDARLDALYAARTQSTWRVFKVARRS
jgi:hypothetical protein